LYAGLGKESEWLSSKELGAGAWRRRQIVAVGRIVRGGLAEKASGDFGERFTRSASD